MQTDRSNKQCFCSPYCIPVIILSELWHYIALCTFRRYILRCRGVIFHQPQLILIYNPEAVATMTCSPVQI
jgi:hypothetical protein